MHILLPGLSSTERSRMLAHRAHQRARFLSAFAGEPAQTYSAALAWKGAAAAARRLPPGASEGARTVSPRRVIDPTRL